MKKLSSSIAAAAFAVSTLTAAMPAAASTVSLDTFTSISGTGSITASGGIIDATWSSAPVSMFATFSVGSAFDLILASFTSNGSASDISAYTLDFFKAGTNAYDRLSVDTVFCNSAPAPIAGRCNTVATGTSGNAGAAARTGDLLFAKLSAGSYRLGIFDNATPTMATASFEVSVVPLPAGGLLLGTGLALLGLGRRMRRQRAA